MDRLAEMADLITRTGLEMAEEGPLGVALFERAVMRVRQAPQTLTADQQSGPFPDERPREPFLYYGIPYPDH